MAARKSTAKKKTRRAKGAPEPRGLEAADTVALPETEALDALEARVHAAGGRALGRYRDPLGGSPLLLAALPLDGVAPTPFQRDLSEPHARRLAEAIERVGVFLDPLIAVAAPERSDGPEGAAFWTPNGSHRLAALHRLGARSVTVLVSPDAALAYRILALNTEKAHGTKERALEAVRMARGLAELDPSRRESELSLELEDGALVTLGLAYEARPRFAGGAYAPALKASDAFLELPLPAALERRGERAERLLGIDDRVAEILAVLKERGFETPYLRNFVVSRLRPFVPRGRQAPDADALLAHMAEKAARFDAAKVRESQVQRAGGGAEE